MKVRCLNSGRVHLELTKYLSHNQGLGLRTLSTTTGTSKSNRFTKAHHSLSLRSEIQILPFLLTFPDLQTSNWIKYTFIMILRSVVRFSSRNPAWNIFGQFLSIKSNFSIILKNTFSKGLCGSRCPLPWNGPVVVPSRWIWMMHR